VGTNIEPEPIQKRNLSNEEAAGERILDLIMNDPIMQGYLAVRCGDAPDGSDEEAETGYYTLCSEWYGHVIGEALTKIRCYK
jgi:hypothetical protein